MSTPKQLQAEHDRELLEAGVRMKFTSQPAKPDTAMYIEWDYWVHMTPAERAIVMAEIVDLAPRGSIIKWRNRPKIQPPITSAVQEGEYQGLNDEDQSVG